MARYDYTELNEAIVQYVRENFGNNTFTIIDLYAVGEQHDAKKHIVKHALNILVNEERISKVGQFIAVRGGSKPTTYRINKHQTAKARKNELQLLAAERQARMNEASLRLAKALGIPTGVAA